MINNVQQVKDTISAAIDKLIEATGNDAFLSETDWRHFLEALPEGDRSFFNRLIELAFKIEKDKNAAGRVTINDLVALKAKIKDELVNYLPVQEGGFEPNIKEKIESEQGAHFLRFAEELKIFSETNGVLPDEELANEIELLGRDLSLGTFASGGQSELLSFFVELTSSPEAINTTTFWEILKSSGSPTFQSMVGAYEIERLEDGRNLLSQLTGFQSNSNLKAKAKKLRQLLLSHLDQVSLVVLFRDGQSFIPLFLIGRSKDGNIIGFYLLVIWS